MVLPDDLRSIWYPEKFWTCRFLTVESPLAPPKTRPFAPAPASLPSTMFASPPSIVTGSVTAGSGDVIEIVCGALPAIPNTI